MADKLLEIKDLEVLYKSGKNPVHAVNGISLTLNKGETLGLVGETGAGKTTTALAILRLLPERTGCINQGQILFEGCDLLTLSEEEMRTQIRGEKISMIFQDPMTSLNPVATVGDQIAEAIIYHSNGQKVSQEQIDQRVGEVLEMGVQVMNAKRHGSSTSGTVAGMVGAIAGAIFLAPLFFGLGAFIGALVGAWLGCLVMELLRGRPGKEAFDAAFGTMMGRFLGTVCKLGTGSAMVVLTAHRIWPDMAPVPPPLRPVVPEPGQVVMLLKNWLC